MPHGLVHDVLFLAFGHHNHGRGRKELLYLHEHLEAAQSGHVLVEHYEVVLLFAAHLERVGTVCSGIDTVAFVLKEDYVGAEKVYFVVHPQELAVLH